MKRNCMTWWRAGVVLYKDIRYTPLFFCCEEFDDSPGMMHGRAEAESEMLLTRAGESLVGSVIARINPSFMLSLVVSILY
jgi:hypothetical protein